MTTINNSTRSSAIASAIVGIGTALLYGPSTAVAAQQDSRAVTQLEEVIVTAERRKGELQTTPVAITAFNEQKMQQLGIRAVADIDGFAPNINILRIPKLGSGMDAFIRGIGTKETALTADPKVGIYVDGVYMSKTMGSVFDIVDIEHIQVLRGPQGTLFGRNTTGGAILVTTKKPTGEFSVNAKGTIGKYDLRRYSVSVDLPSFANVATKLSVYRMKTTGWGENHYNGPPMPPATWYGKNLGSENNRAWRVALRWMPTDNLTVDYALDRTNNFGTPTTVQITAVKDSTYNGFVTKSVPFTTIGGQMYQQMAALASPHDRVRVMNLDSQDREHLDVTAHSLHVEWKHGDTTLKYIFGYRDTDTGYQGTDYGGAYSARDLFYAGGAVTHVPEFSAATHSRISMSTHELQAIGSAFDDKLDYVTGVFYYHEDVAQSQPQTFSIPIEFLLGSAPSLRSAYIAAGFCGPTSSPGPCIGTQRLPLPFADPNSNGLTDFSYGQDSRSWAVYSQASYRLTDAIKLTAGVRYTNDTRKAFLFNENLGQTSLADKLQADHQWDHWSGLLNVNYQITPDKMVYAKYTTSYNAGVFNARASSVTGFTKPAGPETVGAFEVGFKSQWLDNRLRLNLAAFRNDYKDIQVQQFEAGTQGASSRIVNAGEGTYQGFEVDMTAIVVPGLTVNLTYGYLDAKFNDYMQRDPSTNQKVDISDRVTVPFAPKNTASLTTKYEFPRTAIGTFSASISASYKDSFVFDPLRNQYTATRSRTLIDGRLTLADIPLSSGAEDQSKLEISIWGKNLTDKEYRSFGTDFGALGYAANNFGTPRTYGLDVHYRFN